MLRGHRDLKVFQLAYRLAMQVFHESMPFRKKSATRLLTRFGVLLEASSNIAEGFRKRRYPKMFISKFADADGESSETQVWLDFARDCGYLGAGPYAELTAGYEEVGKMLGSMIAHPEKFRAL